MRRVLHRLLSGSAAALLAAAVVGAPATPALAADPAVKVYFPDLAVAGPAPKIGTVLAWLDVPGADADDVVTIGKLTISVDTAGVAGVATVTPYEDEDFFEDQACAKAGTVYTCTVDGPLLLDSGVDVFPVTALQAIADKDAETGATGTLTFRAQVDDAPAVTTTSTVTVGEGVDLAGVVAEPQTVAPGAAAAADLRVTNAGTRPVKGVVMVVLGWDESLRDGKGFSNCTYGVLTLCTFDDELTPGLTYGLSTPMKLRIPADAAAGSRASALGGWYTRSDFKELLATLPGVTDEEILGPKGTGPAAHLEAPAARSARIAPSQVDTDPENNALVSELVVGGTRKPDPAAVGATVTGSAGDRVRASVGFVNNGPGTLYHWTFDNTLPVTQVKVPAGLRAIEFDQNCFPAPDAVTLPDGDELDPGDAQEYLCAPLDGKTKAKASTLFDFTFQVRDNPSGADGRVTIDNESVLGEPGLDRDTTNNTAKIKVSLAGGEGGGLPITGTATSVLAAAGAALLFAGAAGLVLFRRRRVRFTA